MDVHMCVNTSLRNRERQMSDPLSDTSRVTLSDRAYWNDEQHGFSVKLAGNTDIEAVFFVPLLAPDLTALLQDVGGRLYKMLSGAERLALGQNVNSAIRHRLYHFGPALQLLSAVEVGLLDEGQDVREKLH
jgi:hypothetical protein